MDLCPKKTKKSRRYGGALWLTFFVPVNEAIQLAKRGYRQYARKHENPSWIMLIT